MFEHFACVVCLCTKCMDDAPRAQKRALNPLEEELQSWELVCECLEANPGSPKEQNMLAHTYEPLVLAA